MSKEYLIDKDGQKLVVREPSVEDWSKLQKLVKSLRIEYDNFVSEFGDKVIGSFVIKGGYGLESATSIFEWLEQLKEMGKVSGSSVSICPTKVFVVHDHTENEIVGILGLRFIHSDRLDSDVYGNITMTIVPEFRRFGIGTVVMNWVFENWMKLADEYYLMGFSIKDCKENKVYMVCVDYDIASKYFIESLGAEFDCRYDIDYNTYLRYKVSVNRMV